MAPPNDADLAGRSCSGNRPGSRGVKRLKLYANIVLACSGTRSLYVLNPFLYNQTCRYRIRIVVRHMRVNVSRLTSRRVYTVRSFTDQLLLISYTNFVSPNPISNSSRIWPMCIVMYFSFIRFNFF